MPDKPGRAGEGITASKNVSNGRKYFPRSQNTTSPLWNGPNQEKNDPSRADEGFSILFPELRRSVRWRHRTRPRHTRWSMRSAKAARATIPPQTKGSVRGPIVSEWISPIPRSIAISDPIPGAISRARPIRIGLIARIAWVGDKVAFREALCLMY